MHKPLSVFIFLVFSLSISFGQNRNDKTLPEKKEIKMSDAILEKYVGTYALSITPKRRMIITKEDGNLLATLPGVATMKLIFSTDTKFQFQGVSPVSAGEFVISKDSIKIVVSQNGLFEWNKINEVLKK